MIEYKIMLDVIVNSLPVFVAIGLGKLFVSKKLLPVNASDTISAITFKLIGPFFIFSVLYGVSIETKNNYLFIGPVIVFITILIAAYLVGKYIFKLKHKMLGATVLCLITFGAGAVYPFVYRNFPEEIFQNFVIIDLFSFLIFLTIGPLVAFSFGKKGKIDIKEIFFRFFKDPLLVAFFLSFLVIVLRLKVPSVIVETSKFFKESFFLLASLLVGMGLKMPNKEILSNLIKIYLFRTVLVICLITFMFGLDKTLTKPFYLVFLAQYSILAVIYSKEQGLDYEFASQLVLLSMVVQLFIYPIAIAVLR